LAVVLMSARHTGQTSAAARAAEALAIPIRTLERWRQWWQTDLPLTPLWQTQCARFMPPVETRRLPGELLERFAGEGEEALTRLLLFLTPLTVRSLIALRDGR
jgi:hypothetical protein